MSDIPRIRAQIVSTPGVCGGRPRIDGHRIRVQDVALWTESLGLSPDEIVARHPQLTLAQVHTALAYYFEHIDEIRQDIRTGQKFAEELKLQTPSKLVQKLAGGKAHGDEMIGHVEFL